MQSHASRASAVRFGKLKTVLRRAEYYKSLMQCGVSEAQNLLDAFQLFLNSPDLDAAFKGELLVAAQRLSEKSGLYPICFQLKNVSQISQEVVASGGFGDIYKGTFQGEVVCIKVLRVYESSDVDHALKQLYKEAILWGHLLHPNLLTFYGVYRFGNRPCLVAPWMSNGDINKYLKNNPEAPRLHLVDDVAHGLKYLHENGIVHGDLKGPNILVDDAGRARVADFGISSISDSKIVAWTSCSSAASHGGSVRWQAPELFDVENDEAVKNSTASDVYAWACVSYEVFTSTVPFSHLNRDAAVMYQVKQGIRPTQPPSDSLSWREWGLTELIWALMHHCWREAPVERPAILEVISRLHIDRGCDKRPSERVLSPIHFRESVADRTAMSTLDRLIENILGAEAAILPSNSVQVTGKNVQQTAIDEGTSGVTLGIGILDLKPYDIVIPIMGIAGSGKSTFINTLTKGAAGLRVNHDIHDARPRTTSTHSFRCITTTHPNNSTQRIIFLDTPGLDRFDVVDSKTVEGIASWLQTTHTDGIKFAGIIFLQEISQITDLLQMKGNCDELLKLCNTWATRNIVVATSKWDTPPSTSDLMMEAMLQPKTLALYNRPGSKIHRLSDTSFDSAWMIVDLILADAFTFDTGKIRDDIRLMKKSLRKKKRVQSMMPKLEELLASQSTMALRLRRGYDHMLWNALVDNERLIRDIFRQINVKVPLLQKILDFCMF